MPQGTECKENNMKIKELLLKYKEYILYVIFGGFTTVVYYAAYILLTRLTDMNVLAATAISWILSVAFAYVTNRKWVFESKAKGASNILREGGEFVAGRLFTLGLDELLSLIFIVFLGCHDIVIKIIASVLTVILNYIFSKFIIFKGSDDKCKKNE